MAERIKNNPTNCYILSISDCLSVRNTLPSFMRPVEVKLPVDDLPGVESNNVECRYGVFRRKENKHYQLTDLEVVEKDDIPTVQVTSFSE